MFSEPEVELVRESWAAASADPDALAARFYGRLFETAPEVKPLFKGDIRQQGQKLVSMVGIAVRSMRRPEALVPALRELSARHQRYGARRQHYPIVGEVLVATLADTLGEAFGPDARAAWAKTYGVLASVMTSPEL
jgi:nitric oxide dioxygenase